MVSGQKTAVTGQPSASIDKTNFDYGDVKLGNTIQTVFNVKNVGDKDLVFQGEPRVEVLEGCYHRKPSSVRRHSSQVRKPPSSCSL